MTWSCGLNFRSTSAYVTDGTGETYALSSDTYPTTRSMNGGGSSVTFGWNNAPSGSINRTTASPNNPELSGIGYVGVGGSAYFQVDLPATGSYVVRIAMGDGGSANTQAFTILDSTTVLIDGSANVATASNNFIDASLTNRTASAWQTSNTPETLTFATTTCKVHVIGPTSSGSSTLSHFSITAASSGSAGSAIGTSVAKAIQGYMAKSASASNVTGVQGYIGKAAGTAPDAAIQGYIGKSTGTSTGSGIQGYVAKSVGTAAASGIQGYVGKAVGASTVSGVSPSGNVGSAVGASIAKAIQGYIGKAAAQSIVSGIGIGQVWTAVSSVTTSWTDVNGVTTSWTSINPTTTTWTKQ